MDENDELPPIESVDPRIFTAIGKTIMLYFRKYNKKYYLGIIEDAAKDFAEFEKEYYRSCEQSAEDTNRNESAAKQVDNAYQ
jgi:hypothetical protein